MSINIDSGIPLSETLIEKIKIGTAQECIDSLRRMVLENPEKVITRNYYRVNGVYAESAWSKHFGSFDEFKRQAGVILNRYQHAHERNIAKHSSVDHHRALNERSNWDENYLRPTSGKFKTMLVVSDLHDIEIDLFFLRVFIDTAKRVQPDVIVLAGDIFDLPEFGRYTVDPRDWNAAGRIEFVHENILKPLREVCPHVQIDLIEGNHEARVLKHLADNSAAFRDVMDKVHKFTIQKFLGLDRFEVNYIAKADLSAWSKSDYTKQLGNNYKIYYDTVLIHHFPHGRNFNMPGVNGHNHRHVVWSEFNPMFGAYEWHQLGTGHKRNASYCEGEKWHNGFALVHVNSETKSTNFEYIPVTDFSVVGGKWYHRSEAEKY